jgi:SnoaL-like protein
MTDTSEIVDRYLAAWNEADNGRRRELIGTVFAEKATYRDPVQACEGHDGIDEMIAGAQARFIGMRFQRIGDVDVHDGGVRFRWSLGPANSESIVEGTDFATMIDGRFDKVTGFFDKLPAALAS